MDVDNQTFIPGRHAIPTGQRLQPDETAYEMLHNLETTWPCLSFDIIRDHLGEGRARKKYPATVYAVGGTQAAQGREKENEILVMKLSKLSKMDQPGESSDEDDDEDSDPVLETRSIRLNTCTNRIRKHQAEHTDPSQLAHIVTATMTESGDVLIHDITPFLSSFDTPGFAIMSDHSKPLHTIKAHKAVEGFAVDWSSYGPQRRLLTGDGSGKIFFTSQSPDGSWTTDSRPFVGHTGSIEELQWSPAEQTVFASASSDGTVRIWDLRSKAHKAALSMSVSSTDVNVLSWSHTRANLLASGADDGQWGVWDLKQWKEAKPGNDRASGSLASFNFHKEQITSLQWHPTDDSIIAVAAGDNTVTLWDLAVELDDEESKYTADVKDVPPQLLFVHYMQQVKECHWHPQIQGALMATGGDGFGLALLAVS